MIELILLGAVAVVSLILLVILSIMRWRLKKVAKLLDEMAQMLKPFEEK